MKSSIYTFFFSMTILMVTNISTRSISLESEDKSLALPCNVVESLVSPSCDPKEIVVKLKENLHLEQADLEKPSAETTRMIRCLTATAKDTNRIDVVKHLRETMPAGTTGGFACSIWLSVNSFIHQLAPRTIKPDRLVMFTSTAQENRFS